MCAFENISAISVPAETDITNNPGRLLRAKDAMNFLGMTRPTFYRYIKRGIVPKQRYMGSTPYWRLGELQQVFDSLDSAPADRYISPSR